MFERFTDRARRVIVVAQDDARDLGHSLIKPAHILLALAEEPEGAAARAIAEAGVDTEGLRQRVAAAFESSSQGKEADRLPFSPQAKKVLELSLREALQLRHSHIGTEHLLLGVLRQATGDPGLDELLGVGAGRLRKILIATVSGSPSDSLSPALAQAMDRARRLAGRNPMTTGHLLIAMLDDSASHASKVLSALEVTSDIAVRTLAEVPVNDTSDAPPIPSSIEVKIGDTSLRVTDAELVMRLNAATPEQLLDLLRRSLTDHPPEEGR